MNNTTYFADLKQSIIDLFEIEARSGFMDNPSPLYISRMLKLPLDEVEKCMKEM